MHKYLLRTLAVVLTALVAAAASLVALPHAATAQEPLPGLTLTPLGSYATGVFDGAAAEIVAFDPGTRRAFVVNVAAGGIDVLDLSNPAAPALLKTIDVTPWGVAANSVDVYGGVLAAAVEAEKKTANGQAVFFDADGNLLAAVEVGPLPDMLTFTPDGSKVVVANEGEPNQEYDKDPEGSVSIIDLSGGIETLTQNAVINADFTAFNDMELDPAIRIYGPNATVAQDLEPEYIAVSPDSTTAWVTLQENNALAVVDLAAGQAVALIPLGYKDAGLPFALGVQDIPFTGLPAAGTTLAGQEIPLGGFSGLWFDGRDEATGALRFLTHTDRGPNAEPFDVDGDGDDERPFALPDFRPQIVAFAVDPAAGTITITGRIALTQPGGEPITGLPNVAGEHGAANADEEPVDLRGAPLAYDPFGGDFEGIARAADGSFWLVDEYRPAIYHFDPAGVLLDRFIPEGANSEGINLGTEALPAVLGQRRANRGFEAAALDGDILYAFLQSPLDNPDTGSDANAKAARTVRIVAFDTAKGETVGQYLYLLGDAAGMHNGVDKLGDAVALGGGAFLVLERDDRVGPDALKFIYRVNINDATNIHGLDATLPVGPNGGLELQSEQGLLRAGIRPVQKSLYAELTAAGYTAVDKPEGMALVDGATLALINDNDFGLLGSFDPATGALDEHPNPFPSLLSLLFLKPTGFDASDRDGGINIAPWPVLSMFMPDAIAAYAAGGATYLVTANEGDARAYDAFDEETRVGDLVLDLADFPAAALLQREEALGRLRTTAAPGPAGNDTDGDGLADRILAHGARSFSIWDADGHLVWDSGDDFERLLARLLPDGFNSNGENGTFDGRSDDKGVEPEALALGTLGGRTFAFVGLERIGGVMVYDITDPFMPFFVTYATTRDFAGDAAAGTAGDLAPEGIVFVPATDSPTGAPLLIVANELSGSTTVFAVNGAP